MRVGNCPNCGGEVEFRSAGAAETICRFCHSILLATDASLEKLGIAADVPSWPSPVQIGATGVWRDRQFSVVGRVSFESDEGRWGDWYIVFDDGLNGWIPDARQLYAVLAATPPPEPLPPAGEIQENRVFRWNGAHYYVTKVHTALRLGWEGELPSGDWQPRRVTRASLLTPDGRAGFILYGGDAPELYLGDCAEFEDLHFTNLRRPEDLRPAAGELHALNCPGCGGALTLRTGGRALSLACPHCLAFYDASRPELARLRQFAEAQRKQPLLPLGARGRIAGEDYEVVGFQVRTTAVSMGAILFDWHEYVLYHPLRGFRFLTQANGHWNDTRILQAQPEELSGARPAVKAFGQKYQHFSTADAETIYVEGEFPWRLAVDEAARVRDFIRPPYQLTSDSSRRETVWLLGERRTGREIWDAFKLPGAPPPEVGVAANHPAPVRDLTRIWKFGTLLALILLVGGLAYDTFRATLPLAFWGACLLTLLPAVIQTLRLRYFERLRWQWSDYNPQNARFREVSAEPYMTSPYTHEPR